MLDTPKVTNSEPIQAETAIDPGRADRTTLALDEAEERAWNESAALKRYNSRYNNRTYMAIKPGIRAPYCELAEDENMIMNYVIDASLELCGSEYYCGACAKLFKALMGQQAVIGLVVAHLANFS